MKFLCVFAAVLVCVAAESYPEWYLQNARFRRDVKDLPGTTFDRKVGDNGRLFGTLGQNSNGLYGRGGYEHNVFNDHRGKFDAQAHGTRVLGPYGDSSHLGGSLNWKNSNAAASLDVSKQIHGPSSVSAGAGGHWPIGKNGDLSAQGYYSRTQGLGRDYGGRANFNYRW